MIIHRSHNTREMALKYRELACRLLVFSLPLSAKDPRLARVLQKYNPRLDSKEELSSETEESVAAAFEYLRVCLIISVHLMVILHSLSSTSHLQTGGLRICVSLSQAKTSEQRQLSLAAHMLSGCHSVL